MKGIKIVVLAKQVPDTRNVGKDAMKDDGTVNRAALPAIFNPEDLNALEQALRIKDSVSGSTVHVVTMGPGRAAEIIREAIYRGADGGYLLSDRAFAGSDTLATSYALSCALSNIEYDVIVCGRQAIDGDTAQVGPQVAEKLNLPQVTYAEEILSIATDKLTIRRRLERGVEVVECPLPAVITVNGSAAACRPRNAYRMMRYKYAKTPSETQEAKTANGESAAYLYLLDSRPHLKITEWNVTNIKSDAKDLGLSGSPTKVKNIESVVFQAKEAKILQPTDSDLDGLMKELIASHTIG
ncbi:electron transfer flavoprotein subunit beta [Bacteroidia bacterium]|nr:electron transfer flavoprotein subunit beta [Bacteroidia bacterium]